MTLPSLQEREQFIASELAQRGYQPHQVAAVLGSIKQESTFNPGAQEQGGTGLGLFQWSYDRRKKVPGLTGDFKTDARNQLNLFEQELSGPEKKAGEMLRSATDLGGAAAAMKQFERYGVAGGRYQYMNDYLSKLKGGQLSIAQGEGGQSGGMDFASLIKDLPSGMPMRDGGMDLTTAAAGLVGGLGPGLVAGGAGGSSPRYAGSDQFITAAAKILEDPKQQPPAAAQTPSFEMSPSTQSPDGGGVIGLEDFGKRLQGMGFKVGENPIFGTVGKHSPNSHHYSGDAFDLTIQPGSPLLKGKPDSEWKALTSKYGEALRAALPGAEIFHPGNDPVGGHHSHIHLAVPGASKSGIRMTPRLQQLLALAG